MNEGTSIVSVIMPVFNTADFLSESVSSLSAQSFSNWELIAVDDGSTDNSWELLQSYAAVDNRIKVFHKHNEGPTKARAFALSQAKGTYVFYLDSDDYISPHTLEDCFVAIQQEDCSVALPNLVMERPDGDCRDFFAESHLHPGYTMSGMEAFVRSIDWDGVHSSMMCHTELYKSVACNPANIHDEYNTDELITRQIFLKCSRVVLTEGVYCYTNNPDSVSKKLSPKVFGKLTTSLRLIDICRTNSMPDAVIAKAEATALRDMIDLWHTFHRNKQQFTPTQRRDIRKRFKHCFRCLDKTNIRHLLRVKNGITPKLQSLLLTYNWLQCRLALNLSEAFGKENKLFPFFSNESFARI